MRLALSIVAASLLVTVGCGNSGSNAGGDVNINNKRQFFPSWPNTPSVPPNPGSPTSFPSVPTVPDLPDNFPDNNENIPSLPDTEIPNPSQESQNAALIPGTEVAMFVAVTFTAMQFFIWEKDQIIVNFNTFSVNRAMIVYYYKIYFAFSRGIYIHVPIYEEATSSTIAM